MRWLKWGSTGVTERSIRTIEDAAASLRDVARFSGAVAELLTELSKMEILQGKLITGLKTDGTTNGNYFPHALGRPFKGALMVGQSVVPAPITMSSPEAVADNGQDPAKVFGTRQAVGAAATFSVWVF